MRIHSGIAASARGLTRGALAIGNFDGVHLGHRGLFDAARIAAQRLGGPSSAITVHGLVVSSTKIREFTLEGRVEAAAQLLGRPFDLDGDVVRGVGRGRKLGWPTANIRTAAELLPAVGVYAVRARLIEEQSRSEVDTSPGGPDRYIPPRVGAAVRGAANLGLNPTFRDDAHAGSRREPLMLEVHLFDVDEDLYGRTLRVEFVHRLRDERRFPNVDALKEQIGRDVAAARRLLGA